MPDVRLTVAEMDVLLGEPHHARSLYLELRRRMDFRTGIVGLNPRLNEQALRNALYVDSKPGRSSKHVIEPTREFVRSTIRGLAQIGLIEPLGRLVFRCVLAPTDNSVQKSNNRATTILQPDEQPKSARPKNIQNKQIEQGTNSSSNRSSNHGFSEQQPTPGRPDTGKKKEKSARARRAPLSRDKVPSIPEDLDMNHELWAAHWQSRKSMPVAAGLEQIWNKLRAAQKLGWSLNDLLSDALAAGWQAIVFDRHKQPPPQRSSNGGHTNPRTGRRLSAAELASEDMRRLRQRRADNTALAKDGDGVRPEVDGKLRDCIDGEFNVIGNG